MVGCLANKFQGSDYLCFVRAGISTTHYHAKTFACVLRLNVGPPAQMARFISLALLLPS